MNQLWDAGFQGLRTGSDPTVLDELTRTIQDSPQGDVFEVSHVLRKRVGNLVLVSRE